MLFGVQFMRHKKKFTNIMILVYLRNTPYPAIARPLTPHIPLTWFSFISCVHPRTFGRFFGGIFSLSSSAFSSVIPNFWMTYSVKWEGTKNVSCSSFTTTFFKTVSARNSEKNATFQQLLGKPKKPNDQSPVVWKTITANRGLNFNLGFLFFSLKTGIYPDNFHYSL